MAKYLDPKADLTFKKMFGEHFTHIKSTRVTLLLGVILSAITALTACSDNDNPTEPSATDNGAWTLDQDKDESYKPGDDFFMYCNGSWWTKAEVEPTGIVGFFNTDLPKAIKAMEPAEYPNMTKMSRDLVSPLGRPRRCCQQAGT